MLNKYICPKKLKTPDLKRATCPIENLVDLSNTPRLVDIAANYYWKTCTMGNCWFGLIAVCKELVQQWSSLKSLASGALAPQLRAALCLKTGHLYTVSRVTLGVKLQNKFREIMIDILLKLGGTWVPLYLHGFQSWTGELNSGKKVETLSIERVLSWELIPLVLYFLFFIFQSFSFEKPLLVLRGLGEFKLSAKC